MGTSHAPNIGPAALILGPKKDGTAKYPFERVTQTFVVLAIQGETLFDQDLGSTLESNDRILFPHCRCRKPQEHQPILSKWNPVLWMPDDLEVEASVPPGVGERPFRQAPDRESAEDKRACPEREVLGTLGPRPPDGLDLLTRRSVCGEGTGSAVSSGKSS
jgi:hypothetical protein